MADKQQFPAYFACKEDEQGGLDSFHVCGDLEKSQEWKNGLAEKDTENGELSPDNLVDRHIIPNGDNESFPKIIDRLMSSLMSFYDLIGINASVRFVFPNMYIDHEFVRFRNELTLIEGDKSLKIYGVPADKISLMNSKLKRLGHIKDGISSIPANVLMGLVARFDANVSRLVRYLLAIRKERLAAGDRSISVKDILSANSFEELISDLIEDEIHSIMRGSHEEQIKYIEDNFSIKIKEGFERWPQFVEVFERRNLAAHGEGVANGRYDRICSKANVPANHRLSLGDRVVFPDTYLRYATDVLLEFGVLLIWWLWLKHDANDAHQAYNKINSATYDMIYEKRYRLASRILNSCLERKTADAPETIRRMMAINLANCCKKINDDDGFKKAISLYDWSASADEYKISVASLRLDVDAVCAIMPKVVSDDTVGKAGFRDWPVFDWVRDDERFVECFKEVFGEPLQRPKIDGQLASSNSKAEEGVSDNTELLGEPIQDGSKVLH